MLFVLFSSSNETIMCQAGRLCKGHFICLGWCISGHLMNTCAPKNHLVFFTFNLPFPSPPRYFFILRPHAHIFFHSPLFIHLFTLFLRFCTYFLSTFFTWSFISFFFLARPVFSPSAASLFPPWIFQQSDSDRPRCYRQICRASSLKMPTTTTTTTGHPQPK